MRPKINSCFYGIISTILWKNNLEQSFVVFWSVLAKLWSFKVFNPVWVMSHQQMYKTFHPCFHLHIFANFMEKGLLTQCFFFFELMKLQSFDWLNLDVSHVMQANEHKQYANCGLHVNFLKSFGWCSCVLKWEGIILSKSYYFGLRFPLNTIE